MSNTIEVKPNQNIIPVQGKIVKLEKIESVRWKDGHPMGINVGYSRTGKAVSNVEVGQFFYIGDSEEDHRFRSTPVTEVVSQNIFKTRNSIYKITIVE